ncbi:LacI family DNA-binding transcriptional regulator [Cellulosilyticum sp. I15G10I2]|uniref:LacI family DNA-binding transcriptional regulator n=1 Tax=Cellulosilyticum sp. I15G10I2 TaxID=1892843 RepID=UPI00085C899C|nr:LacI family DNA-binding transcriptional regulator [Cellulosilyticum sp. I15G10I2]
MPSIKDVARHAGVSTTTVSRVMNNFPNISESTRKKVFDSIRTLDYHPDYIARSLSKKQSLIIGVIIPDCSHMFFSELVKHIEMTAQNNGYKILLCNSLDDKEKELSYINMLKEKRVDGIIMGSHLINTEAYKSIEKPIITFDRCLDDKIPYVGSDNFTGGVLATQHLIDRGCKKLLHISGSLKLTSLANKRSDGFKLTCLENNVSYQIIEYQHTKLTFDYFYDFIEKEVSKFLHTVDGVFCSNDMLAYALYVYCLNNNLTVPEDIKIIGYDNSQFTRILQNPKITTIAQPIQILGELLCSNIIRLIEHDEQAKVYSQIVAVELVQGTTT